MKIIQYAIRAVIAGLIVSFTIIALRAVISKTPNHINIEPIYSFKVEGTFTAIEELAKRSAQEVRRDKWDPDKTPFILVSLPKGKTENDDLRNVFRDVNIFQFGSKQGAQKTYIKHRQIFAEEGYGRLYRAGGKEDDKYFISYEPAHFDYNHGIPCGVVASPKIHAAFQKSNLFILVSYTGYRDYDNYVKEMNEDIAYIGELFKTLPR